MSINRRMNKETIVVHTMNTTHNTKEETTDTPNNIGDYQNIVLSGRSQKQRTSCRFHVYTVLE